MIWFPWASVRYAFGTSVSSIDLSRIDMWLKSSLDRQLIIAPESMSALVFVFAMLIFSSRRWSKGILLLFCRSGMSSLFSFSGGFGLLLIIPRKFVTCSIFMCISSFLRVLFCQSLFFGLPFFVVCCSCWLNMSLGDFLGSLMVSVLLSLDFWRLLYSEFSNLLNSGFILSDLVCSSLGDCGFVMSLGSYSGVESFS